MSLLDKIKVKPPKGLSSNVALVATPPISDVAEVVNAWGSGRITSANVCEAFGKKSTNPSAAGEGVVMMALKRLYAEGYAIRSPLELAPGTPGRRP